MLANSEGDTILVLFDQYCSVCRVLAGLVSEDSPRHWQFLAWQSYTVPNTAPETWHEKHPSELRVQTKDQFLEGEKAWRYLIEHNPKLKTYQRLAAKVGVSPPRGARWLQMLGHGIRRLCYSCVYYRRS